MNRHLAFAVMISLSAAVAVPAISIPAHAQVDIRIVTPQRNALGDKDRDGIPNVVDQRNNNPQQAWDRDRDGVANRNDPYDNRALKDKDRDGVPNAWDKYDRNAHRP